jgi:hypothetical protein
MRCSARSVSRSGTLLPRLSGGETRGRVRARQPREDPSTPATSTAPPPKRAILRIRDDAVAHDLLGRTLASEGNLGEAEKEFERALKVDPTMQQAREDLQMVRRAGR